MMSFSLRLRRIWDVARWSRVKLLEGLKTIPPHSQGQQRPRHPIVQQSTSSSIVILFNEFCLSSLSLFFLSLPKGTSNMKVTAAGKSSTKLVGPSPQRPEQDRNRTRAVSNDKNASTTPRQSSDNYAKAIISGFRNTTTKMLDHAEKIVL